MLKLRDLVAGGVLATFLVACSAASPSVPGAAETAVPGLEETAAAGVGAAQTAVPGLEETAASGAAAAATALPTVAPAAQGTVEAATGMSAADMTAMIGQSMTISGPVSQITDSLLFQVSDPTHGEVVVLVPTGSFSVAEGQEVEVTGTVAQFDPAALEQQLGIDLDDSVVANIQSTTILVAQTVNPSSAG